MSGFVALAGSVDQLLGELESWLRARERGPSTVANRQLEREPRPPPDDRQAFPSASGALVAERTGLTRGSATQHHLEQPDVAGVVAYSTGRGTVEAWRAAWGPLAVGAA